LAQPIEERLHGKTARLFYDLRIFQHVDPVTADKFTPHRHRFGGVLRQCAVDRLMLPNEHRNFAVFGL